MQSQSPTVLCTSLYIILYRRGGLLLCTNIYKCTSGALDQAHTNETGSGEVEQVGRKISNEVGMQRGLTGDFRRGEGRR